MHPEADCLSTDRRADGWDNGTHALPSERLWAVRDGEKIQLGENDNSLIIFYPCSSQGLGDASLALYDVMTKRYHSLIYCEGV